ncbi:MAG: hypothetical protein K1X33_08000 [Methanobacteriaceae archaeon]|nr:hypothetical protein [Methanobacteriaceae archaeon]
MVNKILATIISFFLPGIGALIQGGETKKNVGLFIVAIILWILGLTVSPIISYLYIILSIYSAYDTYQLEP